MQDNRGRDRIGSCDSNIGRKHEYPHEISFLIYILISYHYNADVFTLIAACPKEVDMAYDMRVESSTPPPTLSLANLRQTASWIRDDLDPLVAREGPDIMHPDDVLNLQELFKDLQLYRLDLSVIAASRIHRAVQEVCGKATRWPQKLAEECDKVGMTGDRGF